MAAPSAASAATGPLLSLTPERVSNGHLALAGQPWRVRVVMQPWVEGQTATVRFYRHGHKLRVVNVNLTMSPTGKSGMALVAFGTSKPGTVQVQATHLATPTATQLVAKPVRVDVAALHAAPGRARARRAPAPAAPGGQGLRRRAARPLRRAHRARRARLPQGDRHGAHDDRRHRPVQGAAGRQGHLQGAPPRPRQARRGRPLAPGDRAHPGLARGAHLPGELGQAVDADGPGELPGLLEVARLQRQGHVLLRLLHPRLRHPRLRPGAGLRRQPRLPAHPHPRRVSVFRWIKIGDIVDVYP